MVSKKDDKTLPPQVRIALIDDDEDLNLFFTAILEAEGYNISSFLDGKSFLKAVEQNADQFGLVLSDYILPDTDGFQLYNSCKSMGLSCPYLLMTAYGDFDIAVQALKSGVADYIIKPVKEDVLLRKVSAYIEHRTLEEEVIFNRLGRQIIAQSPAMQDILKKLSRIAKSRASILLTGESGTGKEVLSKMLHDISPRQQDGRFVGVNVSAIPDTLFEAEFFGYTRGAFTGAHRDHDGYAKMADGGTLFLDEVGDLSTASQVKLLRLLEERQVQALGSKEVHSVDFRLISATNADLNDMIQQGTFRGDLYYRLAVISVNIPPLRERPEDIVPLARHLLKQLAEEEDSPVLDFTPQAQQALLAYNWPGNIRELKNRVYESLLATDQKWIEVSDLNLPGQFSQDDQPLAYDKAKAHFERTYITRLLKVTSGNINKISELAGLSRKAVYDLMKRHEIDPAHFRNR
ncbi:MAG TPA: two-component system response regulator GlrR [Myxococcales bacterium]|nr:two-component system response regulator GlrR [Deltaproteobacteria bacterium]MBU51079.1 two-component system response regulator GlrR [Deltaproteobacteria bacterium]HAA57503.1 two-component system response regulator GlrR [Myxococcales bacterium]|tara:strand:+ start:3229 stop:4611 length:1383 start_codon:yes stop_codon:yes gene_type:complete